MCTLIVAFRALPDIPLLVAANRDEFLNRPSSPPRVLERGGRRIFAPIDLQAGGTWLGLNENGVFAGLTNRSGESLHTDRRSRGLLVLDALEEATAAAAAERIAGFAGDAHNGFHLVVADRDAAFLVHSDHDVLHCRQLEPGVHVVTERSLGAAENGRERWLLGRVRDLEERGDLIEGDLIGLLSTHAGDDILGPCVHLPGLNYGTRSSTVLRLGEAPDDVRFLHAEGPPCTTEYVDMSDDARALLRS